MSKPERIRWQRATGIDTTDSMYLYKNVGPFRFVLFRNNKYNHWGLNVKLRSDELERRCMIGELNKFHSYGEMFRMADARVKKFRPQEHSWFYWSPTGRIKRVSLHEVLTKIEDLKEIDDEKQ